MILYRLVVILGSLCLAAASFVSAASEASRDQLGQLVRTDTALSAEATEALADMQFSLLLAEAAEKDRLDPKVPVTGQLEKLILAAFAVDPLDESALRMLSFGYTLPRDAEAGRQAFELAAQVNKRDPLVNLWLAQDHIRKQDMEGALGWLDVALRSNMRMREPMFANVMQYLSAKEGPKVIGTLLATDPNWKNDFWRHFSVNPVALENAGRFFRESGIDVTSIDPVLRRDLYFRLRQSKHYRNLFEIASEDPDVKDELARLYKGSFENAGQTVGLGWELSSQGAFAASVSSRTGQMSLDTQPGAFGEAAQLAVAFVGPAIARVELAEMLPDGIELDLHVDCVTSDDKRELGRVRLAAGARTGSAGIDPGKCRYGVLRLNFDAQASRNSLSVKIDRIGFDGPRAAVKQATK